MGVASQQLNVVLIAGTRPEAIKLAPLIKVLADRHRFTSTLILSGQHPTMAHAALAEFGLTADRDLAIANPGMTAFCTGLESALLPLLSDISPDLVIVQGDTNTAWVSAHVASRLGFPVGHVEAGLRSGHMELPWPEERNRQEIDAVSTLLFTPCAKATRAVETLSGTICETGNTGIDALREALDGRFERSPLRARRRILVTCHRRETIAHITEIALALRTLADRPDVEITLPLHPNPAFSEGLGPLLADHPNIHIEQPMPYRELTRRLLDSDLLLTDSGGLQEEAPALGLPTLVLRTTTERWEPIERGCARLIGPTAAAILSETAALLDDPAAYAAMARACFPYGKGDAAARIADAIEAWWADCLPFPSAAACSKGAAHGRKDHGNELDAGQLASSRSEAAARLS